MKNLNIPVGVSDFTEIRKNGYYYIDKSGLIKDILKTASTKVTLITRPRRFGKTLAMSMLDAYFDIRKDSKQLFDGLEISQNQVLCSEWMNKYPTIFVSFRQVEGLDFKGAYDMLTVVIANLFNEHIYLLDSKKATEFQKTSFKNLLSGNASVKEVKSSIYLLMNMMNDYYNEPVILLIDEYDVPLDKAFQNGYYQEMVSLLRGFFGQALKTNEFLQFAVLTGCLRVSKESIFTGLNNFEINSIVDIEHDEQFGFTEDEVHKLLEDYQLTEYDSDIKEWYDGYRFGNADVYCPWDVINYCDAHRRNPMLPPENYWTNTSGNDVLKHFIESAGAAKGLAKTDLERLVNGEIVEKDIREDLTYNELYASMDNLWSTLFMAGYLTHKGRVDTKRFRLAVPNREIRNIITEQVLALFKQNVEKDGQLLNDFCTALSDGHTDEVERLFSEYMKKTISVRDTFARKELKENFYHGLLLGILGFKAGWSVMSNRESGNGFSDIMIMIDDAEIGIVIEVKYAESHDLEAVCKDALKQMIDKRYAEYFEQQGIKKILKYGIACRVKECKVMLEEN